MVQLWLLPADEFSFQQTLDQPIDLSDQQDKPRNFPDSTRVWGVRTDLEQGGWERNRRNLERMETGDPVLIYRNSTGQYHSSGKIGEFWHTTYIRDEFWNGGPAVDVFSIQDYEEVYISPEVINELLEYKKTFRPQGLWRVADDRPVDRLLKKLED